MPRHCTICGKTSQLGVTLVKLRGKYNPTAKTRKYPNIQWVRLPAGKAGLVSGKRVKACAQCIKTLHKKTK